MSNKRLRSAIHGIGQHSLSGLSYLHPHLGEFCRRAGCRSASIDLLTGEVESLGRKPSGPLRKAAACLPARFAAILESERIDIGSLQSARIEIHFGRYPAPESGFVGPDSCYLRVETEAGRVLEAAMDDVGRKARLVK